ncbi:malto-oligosyltrehalose trehalohydrolase [Dyadobacter luticola]|uniref:Malto-oligosyltrehalose trehalohydrolase n=1 Tax=Dyadobacter luticola TaxID=1979387 RepID=A0A5R9L4C5_9BACT|nr:malto-oligosyltrehalose trehalohydrolase [Dyadobacter luticola]TLV03268.1 malto-oligosyltrehalose trehalohydrolase [Dyadobacter luticola]
MKKAGAFVHADQTTFTVWAPEKQSMKLHLISPQQQELDMQPDGDGYFTLTVSNVGDGAKYLLAPENGQAYPDPASHCQPEGVHGPSQVIDHASYHWTDVSWKGLALSELVLYELHVGTFTPEGTFDAIIPRLDQLAETGINTIELMPVIEFPGNRNWGYDGVYPYSVHHSYGGPEGLKRLVDAAHARGIAVILDVVFNHLGPEGNYFAEFGPYFTDTYNTPWGRAINMDGEWSDGVRDYFSGIALHWYELYHVDGLRVDAIHTIYDNGAVHFWELVYEKLKTARQKNGHPFHVIAESDLNSPRVVKSPEYGGYGFTAQWLDDFHHALYVLLDEKGRERYVDFGRLEQFGKAITDGFVHSGEYVKFRKRTHGAPSVGIPGDQFVVFNQNHDQVGNRVGGERLSVLIDFEKQKVATAAMLLAPYLPMFFMGEEYGEDNPFFYFVSHTEEELIEKVVEGRKKEFESYQWDRDPLNPQETETFEKSKLQWEKRDEGKYRIMLEWNKTLISLRKKNPALCNFNKNDVRFNMLNDRAFVLFRRSADQKTELACVFNLSDETIVWTFPHAQPQWSLLLDSTDEMWSENVQLNNASRKDPVNVGYKISVHGAGVKVLYHH